jgi:hypothetical protein
MIDILSLQMEMDVLSVMFYSLPKVVNIDFLLLLNVLELKTEMAAVDFSAMVYNPLKMVKFDLLLLLNFSV